MHGAKLFVSMPSTLSLGLLFAFVAATLAQGRHNIESLRHASTWRDKVESDRESRQGDSAPVAWMLFLIMAAVAVVHRACVKHAPVFHAIDFAFRMRRPDMVEGQYEAQTTIELSGSPRGY